GSAWSFCSCAAVWGTITLKPAATRRFSLFCVCVLVQLTARARSANALIRLNPVNICFISFPFLLVSCLVWLVTYLMVEYLDQKIKVTWLAVVVGKKIDGAQLRSLFIL